MRKFSWIIPALLFMFIGAPRAHADTMFNVSGTAQNVSGVDLGTCAAFATCSFSGTLTIDTTTGALTAADITLPGLSAFDSVAVSEAFSNDWALYLTNGGGDSLIFDFSTSPTAGSLVGFTGGTITSILADITTSGNSLYIFGAGTITPQTATAVPEPGTLVLLLFGLVALVLVRKRMARGLQPVT